MKECYVIGLSGGKDSTACALLLKDKENVHYAFADTGAELPETYEYLDRLEKYFDKPIDRLFSKYGTLEEIIKKWKGFLPSARSRYCTRLSKIEPFRRYLDNLALTHDVVYNVVGIRADEERQGYVPCGELQHKIKTYMPLKEKGMNEQDVVDLVEAEVGMPTYYEWRTRSGCYFCFFQRRIEFVNLMRRHPDLFEKAKSFEKEDFSWLKNFPLSELEQKSEAIEKRYNKKLEKEKMKDLQMNLFECSMCR